MSRKVLAVISLIPCLVMVMWTGLRLSSQGPSQRPSVIEMQAAVGGHEDPEARARFKWLRLHDPATGRIPQNIRTRELQFARTLTANQSDLRPSTDVLGAQSVSLDWFPRGPFNVGGRTRALAVDVTNENIILAGAVSGGMWRSTNGGASWLNSTAPSDLHSITTLEQDTRPGKTSIWYYGTGEVNGNSASHVSTLFLGDGIFKSTNGGLSWQQLASTVSGTPQFISAFDVIWNLAVDASNTSQDEVYAATFSGISRSVDGGVSWTTVLGGFNFNLGSLYTDVAITSAGVVYAAMSEATITGQSAANPGIFRSTDGESWNEITPNGWPSIYKRTLIGIAPSNEDVVYFLANTPGSGFQTSDSPLGDDANSLWKYDHSSTSWIDLSANLPAFGNPVGDFTSQNSYDMLVCVKPDNENVVFVGGANLYRSTDGFASTANTAWIGGYAPVNNVSQYQNHHPDMHSQAFLPSNPNTVLSAHDGGLSRTADVMATSVAWSSLNNGYISSQFYSVAIDPATSGSNKIMGGMQDNGIFYTNSSSFTQPWSPLATGDGAFCAFQDGGNAGLLSTQEGKAFRGTINSSGQLTAFTRIDPTGGSGYLFINPFTLDPNNDNLMYLAGGDRLWRNSDLSGIPLNFSDNTTSINWSELSNTIVGATTISAIGVSTSPANRVYYGTSDGDVYRVDQANTGDPIPTDVGTGKGLPGGYLACVAVDPTNADQAMLVFSSYQIPSLFYTSDGGATWTDVSANLEENPDGSGVGPSVRWAAILPANGSTYYFVAATTGLYSTANLNGSSTVWVQEGATTIGNVVVDMVVTRPSDGRVVAATHGQGIYSSTVTVTSVEDTAPAVPQSYALHANYPNPFNPTTVIRYSLPETHGSRNVQLDVYNSQGKQVRTLVNGEQRAGDYQLVWDGLDDAGAQVASGVYVYRLRAGDFVESRKMILVR